MWALEVETHGPRHHRQPRPFTMGASGAGVSGDKGCLEFEEGNMGIPGGVKVSQVKVSKSSKKEMRGRRESFYSCQGTSSWLKTGVSSDWCHSMCNKECVLAMILYSMQIAPVIMFHNQPGGWDREHAFYVRLRNCDRSHLRMMVSNWWSRFWFGPHTASSTPGCVWTSSWLLSEGSQCSD